MEWYEAEVSELTAPEDLGDAHVVNAARHGRAAPLMAEILET